MADTGFNGAIAVHPDGTVQVAQTIDVNGAIAAGDFATHTDLDDALASANAYTDALSADVVHGAGLAVSAEYSVYLPPSAMSPGQSIAVLGGPYTEGFGVWPEWTIAGHFVPAVICEVAYPEITDPSSGGQLQFNFASVASGLQNAEGTFYFHFIGTP